MDGTRRDYLKTGVQGGAALLAAGALTLPAGPAEADHGQKQGDTLYGHGMVWNRELRGVAGDLKLSFDLRVNLETGKGFGTAEDPVHPDWDIHFAIDSVKQEKRPKGEARYTMTGVVTRANNPANVGQTVAIIAETVGDTTAIAIRLGDLAFGGAGIVTIEYLVLGTFLALALIAGMHL
jgi:hypothetical protein